MAAYLESVGIRPDCFIAGPLRRTREFAEIVAHKFERDIVIDHRLREIDYGTWEGLTSAEIDASSGGNLLIEWQEYLLWPQFGVWRDRESTVVERVRSFLMHMHRRWLDQPRTTFACTSNGIARLARHILDGARSPDDTKMQTGALSVLEATADGWQIRVWNERPQS